MGRIGRATVLDNLEPTAVDSDTGGAAVDILGAAADRRADIRTAGRDVFAAAAIDCRAARRAASLSSAAA